jgi:WD40 repeat protein
VTLWDTRNHRNRLAFATGAGYTYAMATGPDGSWLATSGADHEVRIWDTSTGSQVTH